MSDPKSMCQAVCAQIVRRVPDAVLCCGIELSSQRLVYVQPSRQPFEPRWLEKIAETVQAMFSGKKVRRMQKVIARSLTTDLPAPTELFLKGDANLFFMKRLPGEDVVILLATTRETNQGLGWMALRNSVDDLALDSSGRMPIATGRIGLSRPRSPTRVKRPKPAPEVVPSQTLSDSSRRRLPVTGRPRLLGLGRNLRAARIARGFSTRDLAARLGVSREELEAWEKGRAAIPKKHREALCELLPAARKLLS